jgi:hypothetical protein
MRFLMIAAAATFLLPAAPPAQACNAALHSA